MPKSCLFVFHLCLFLATSSFAQEFYTVDCFQDEYEELEDYSSIAYETLEDRTWTKKFELEFQFPFFDTVYDHIVYDYKSVGRFEGSEDFNLFLFSCLYEFDKVTDPNDIDSDVRYVQLEKEGKKALVFQYTKIRIRTDPSIEEYNSSLNFQVWLYENGDIEIRFGPMNLENSPSYVPGEGFYITFGDTSILLGPDVRFQHPDSSRSSGIAVAGPYMECNVHYNEPAGFLSTVPPEGWVIKFNKKAVSSTNYQISQDFSVHPNPARRYVNIETENAIDHVFIYSTDGSLVSDKGSTKKVDISSLPGGMYYMQIISNGYTLNKKFIKQ